MKHYAIIRFIGSSPAPQGTGDTRSWFFYYKFRPGEDELVYLTAPGIEEVVAENDRLWFVMDDVLVGCVPVRSVQHDHINDRYEIWFNGKDIHPLSIPFSIEVELQIGTGALWEQLSKSPPSPSTGT